MCMCDLIVIIAVILLGRTGCCFRILGWRLWLLGWLSIRAVFIIGWLYGGGFLRMLLLSATIWIGITIVLVIISALCMLGLLSMWSTFVFMISSYLSFSTCSPDISNTLLPVSYTSPMFPLPHYANPAQSSRNFYPPHP